MKSIKVVRRKFHIRFPYNSDIIAAIRLLPIRVYKSTATDKWWEVPVRFAKQVKSFADTHGFEFDFSPYADSYDPAPLLDKLRSSPLYQKLRPFQKIGAEFLLKTKQAYLADDMGVGKSIQTIAAIYTTELFPALIVTKKVLKLNFKGEVEKWSDARAHIINGKKPYDLPQAEFYIINYDLLDVWLSTLLNLKFKAIAFDEFHYIKESKSKRGKAAFQLAQNIDFKFGLSGTPILNRVKELIHQLAILDRLDDFGGKWRFIRRYCDPQNTDFGINYDGASNQEELYQKLYSTCMLRRLKKDVVKELKPVQHVDIRLDISNRQEYDFAHAELVKWLQQEAKPDDEFEQSIAELDSQKQAQARWRRRQLLEHDTVLGEHLVRLEKLKQLCATGKLDSAVEWVNAVLDSGEKLILFCTHKLIQQDLIKKFPHAATIFGSDSAETRLNSEKAFQNDRNVNLIICSIDAAAEGLNLTAASNVAFLEFPWVPAKLQQAIARADRIGQENAITSYYLIGQNTIDGYIFDMLASKLGVIDAVIEGKEVSIAQDLIEKLIQ